MAAPKNISEVVNRLTGGNSAVPECFHFHKETGELTVVTGGLFSAWTVNGIPGPGAIPLSASNPDNTLAGAMRMTSPSGGKKRWLRSGFIASYGVARVIVYDRLFHTGGLNGTLTTAQTVGGAVTRYTGQESLGNIMILEMYATMGATQVNATVNYLDKDGNSRTSPTVAFAGATVGRSLGTCVQVPFNTADGANSVTSVVDVTLSATTGIAGNFGVTICRPLFEIDIGSVDSSGFGHAARYMDLELAGTELKAGACINFLFSCQASLAFTRGNYVSVEN